MSIQLSELMTFAVGLAGLAVAGEIVRRIPILARINVPVPVLGGLLVSALAGLLNRFGGTPIQFATHLTDFFLLVFFTTVGLSAKLSSLKAGGRPLVILLAVTVLLLIVQNIVGMLIASLVGAHAMYGLLVGSISFVGGPGTAAAWAKEAQAMGLARAPEIAVSAATLAVVVGAIVAGPITGWLIRRQNLSGPSGQTPAGWIEPETTGPTAATPIASVMQVLLLIVVAVLVGGAANDWAREAGFVLPGFLTAMLAGVAIANLGDATGVKIDIVPVERGGQIALQAFLVMYLMSLQLWTLGAAIWPLVANVVIQVLVTAIIGVLLLFRWLGRDYDAAVTVGGFLGFGLSSMPVAMSTMDSIASRYGPSPKAFLLIALAGSFFVDLANAVIVKGFMLLPWLH
jgi:glutamate:Na+ symporter, ESS family